MKEEYLKIKDWFYSKTSETAERYNTFIDVFSRNEYGMILAENGYITVRAQEVLNESEKAIQVVLSTGAVDGSVKGWKCWIPKSVIKLN